MKKVLTFHQLYNILNFSIVEIKALQESGITEFGGKNLTHLLKLAKELQKETLHSDGHFFKIEEYNPF